MDALAFAVAEQLDLNPRLKFVFQMEDSDEDDWTGEKVTSSVLRKRHQLMNRGHSKPDLMPSLIAWCTTMCLCMLIT